MHDLTFWIDGRSHGTAIYNASVMSNALQESAAVYHIVRSIGALRIYIAFK